jgi:DNA ligase (NAD+)
VGVSSARAVMEHFGSVDDLAKAEIADLLKVQDIGAIVAESIHAWFRDERSMKLLERLRAAGLNFANPKVEQASDKFAGTTWVITGTLSQGREEIADLIRANGGKVSGSVSGKTTYLLAGEEAGSKLEKATKLGVKVLTESDFRAML